jgi:hypothetical protein
MPKGLLILKPLHRHRGDGRCTDFDVRKGKPSERERGPLRLDRLRAEILNWLPAQTEHRLLDRRVRN